MAKVKQGHLEHMGLLFERYHRQLFSYFYRMVSHAENSEDLVQEVFYRILKYKHTFTGEGKFTTWMFHLARNVCIDHYQKQGKRGKQLPVAEEAGHIPDEHHLPDEQLSAKEESVMLAKALDKLPLEYKEVIVLSKYEELKYAEIGELLGCSEGAVKVKVFRAMQALKKAYSEFEHARA